MSFKQILRDTKTIAAWVWIGLIEAVFKKQNYTIVNELLLRMDQEQLSYLLKDRDDQYSNYSATKDCLWIDLLNSGQS